MPRRFFFPVAIVIFLLIVDIFLVNEVNFERNFPPFRAFDTDRKFFSNENFRGKITVLCIWTNDTNSVALLKELAAWENLPPNVQIVGLIGEPKDSAARIVAKKIAPSIQQILANDDLAPILTKIKIAPTTIFVDAQGNLVGQAVTGAEINLVRRELARILEMDSPRTQALLKIQASIFR